MVDLIVDMDYGKCSYTRIFLVYAETSRSDSKGFQKIPKVYDYDYDITFFLVNQRYKNKIKKTPPHRLSQGTPRCPTRQRVSRDPSRSSRVQWFGP